MSPTWQHNSTGKVTAADVARAAGVSQSTVSRAFSRGPAPKQKARILEVAAEMGYHPNALARALAANRSGIIALIASGLEDTFLSALLGGIIEGLQQRQLQLLVFSLESAEQLPEVLEKLHQYQIDGMLVTSAFLDQEAMGRLEELGKPIVLINRYLPGALVRAVCCDNEAGAAALVEHLAATGRRRIALAAGPLQSYTAQSRARGFFDRMAALGLTPAGSFHAAGHRNPYGSGRRAAAALLPRQPDAILCTSDMLAVGVLEALREADLTESIAVAGFDGHPCAAWPSYDLTTVAQPLERLVEAAVSTLCDMLAGHEALPPCRLFPGELVVRGSTAKGVGLAEH